ncbi:hypothetical protein CONPUDRAFT_150201 [Coniophora puteana RWD-64-598 SS2]|uniref:Alpha-mannosyltransferase n=1 Tax=Coniophora puteana (strain RWD-64-598) TaxID=741705 RepID=A0A5M3N1Y0_CONPW|nr:uncharacterized protein CONPUDRAFT_150201 [Coniophora puteana RWD-64-598 SS2]EIW85389.1 hypothetical protein CONPUDRAFT_150201 [Coniophora puteana RWD-64-598 SS2]
MLGRGLPDYAKLSGVPLPKPLPNFDYTKAKPRPYRPFRWEYHQTMSLKSLDPDFWLEIESTYRERMTQRIQLFAKHGRRIVDYMPGSEDACKELMEMAIQFLCARYPRQFRYDAWTGVFYNDILSSQSDTRKLHPLVVLLQNVPEDFLITLEDKETGLYVMRAGVSCSAVGWNMSEKIGRPLHQIHGPVPDYKEKMAFSMDRYARTFSYFTQTLQLTPCDRYFSKMPNSKPIQRGSWGFEVGEPLFLQTDEPEWGVRQKQDPDVAISDLYMRVDWQTLRRLPRSRAIVFNFKALFTPLTDFRDEPYIPKLVLKVLKEGKKSIMEYKGTWHVEHKVIPALEQWSKEQEDKGMVPKDWKVRTLDEDPFYPGWQERWNQA